MQKSIILQLEDISYSPHALAHFVAQCIVSHTWKTRVKHHMKAMILFLACQAPMQASADQIIPFYCSLDPIQLPVDPIPDMTFQVPASHAIIYTERSKCQLLSVGTITKETFCFAKQSGGDHGYYRCGAKVPTGCVGLDLIEIVSFSITPHPDGTSMLCATARNSQPDNDRYVDIYFKYQQKLPVKKERPQN